MCGIYSSIKEMIPYPVPVFFDGTLLPYEGKIITDGLIRAIPIQIRGNIIKTLEKTYKDAKNKGQIIQKLR